MAKETKIVEVAPSDLDSTIEFWGSFGWDVISNTTVDTRRVEHVDGDVKEDMFGNVSQKINKVHSGEKYYSITFQRDKSMRNYEKLAALEKKYFSLSPPPPPKYEPAKPKKISVLLIILSIVGLFIYVIPGLIFILISVIKYVTYPNKLKKWEADKKAYANGNAQYQAALKEKEAVLQQAQALC